MFTMTEPTPASLSSDVTSKVSNHRSALYVSLNVKETSAVTEQLYIQTPETFCGFQSAVSFSTHVETRLPSAMFSHTARLSVCAEANDMPDKRRDNEISIKAIF